MYVLENSCLLVNDHSVTNITTEKQRKLALSPHDDKRYLIEGSTDTLPWGYYSIRM